MHLKDMRLPDFQIRLKERTNFRVTIMSEKSTDHSSIQNGIQQLHQYSGCNKQIK